MLITHRDTPVSHYSRNIHVASETVSCTRRLVGRRTYLLDNKSYPTRIAPFSSDESRIRRRCVGDQLALVTKTVDDVGIWAHLRPVSDCLCPACCRHSGRTVSTLMHLPAVIWQ